MNCNFIFQKLILSAFLLIFVPFLSVASIIILNGLTHENQMQAGETHRGSIQIQNASEKNRSVRIYQRDYWFSYTGESRHDPAGTMERSNAGWITFNPELINLAPNEKATINFEVSVPGGESLSGTFWSVLMVEGIETGTRDIQFLGLEMGKQEETTLLHVALENTGERLLRPELALELFDEAGNSAGVLKAESRKTFPGTSVLITLRLEGIKPGNYTGVLVADCDNDHVFGTNVSFEIG
jgi:hypothetical protein